MKIYLLHTIEFCCETSYQHALGKRVVFTGVKPINPKILYLTSIIIYDALL